MIVRCPKCNKAYKIPEERLRGDKELAFHCLACKTGLVRISPSQKTGTMKPGPSKSVLERAIGPKNFPSASSGKKPNHPPSDDYNKNDDKDDVSAKDIRRSIVQSISNLPPMPQIVIKAREIIANPMTGLRELAALVEKDQAITTQVLRLANSAYYGLSGKVSTIQHASVMLGEQTLGEVITTAAAGGLMDKNLKGYGMSATILWRHSMFVAIASRMIADKNNPDLANDAHIAGLIHDVGKIILDGYVLEQRKLFANCLRDGAGDHFSAEREIFEFTHCDIGFDICRSWGIPKLITGAIRYHHDPSYSLGNILSYIVFMANSLALNHEANEKGEEILEKPDERVMGVLDLDENQLVDIMKKAGEAVDQIAASL